MNNLTLLANSKINGGEYNKIKIFGETVVTGNLLANKMDVFGASRFESECQITCVNVYGAADFNSQVKIDELTVKGSCNFKSETSIKKINVYGASNFCDQVFKFEEVNVYGALNAKVLEADKILVKGALNCSEQLNADLIEFTSTGHGKINEMVGSKIMVKPKTGLFHLKKDQNVIEVELIEGDDIDIENVKAKVVRGNNVKIGNNCEIDLVEYSNDLKVSDNSQIKETNKF